MDEPNPSPNDTPGAGWQILGELELRQGADLEQAIPAWLDEALGTLHLSADFLSKIRQSAQEAAAGAFQAEGGARFEHIHLRLLQPRRQAAKIATWGFFRIEKGEPGKGETAPGHTVEIYLYPEQL